MRKLNRDDSLRSQQQLDPSHKVIDVGNLSKDIVPEYEIRPPALGNQLACCLPAEELDQRGNVLSPCYLGDIGCRFNS